ncbi:MAG: NUDIX hydrolase [Bacteroidota bacterium]
MFYRIDSNGDPTGEVLSRKEMHRLGKLHRAIHLYLFNKDNNLLLQRRSAYADHSSGLFSISVTGHVDAGECSIEAVRRELGEELGLNSKHEYFKLLFSSREVSEIKCISLSHFKTMVESGDGEIVPM